MSTPPGHAPGNGQNLNAFLMAELTNCPFFPFARKPGYFCLSSTDPMSPD